MCENTVSKIVRRNYTRLPMPDWIIYKLEKLAVRERTKNGVSFRNKHKELENEEQNKDQVKPEQN